MLSKKVVYQPKILFTKLFKSLQTYYTHTHIPTSIYRVRTYYYLTKGCNQLLHISMTLCKPIVSKKTNEATFCA